jgi:DNA (cytosine-5)-methyltransferase 1
MTKRSGQKPIMIDLYCRQGGATKGFQDAGFHVIGVDIEPQPRYCGDTFIQADAVQWLKDNTAWIKDNAVLVAGSPPCQFYSATQRIMQNEHPDLIGPTRDVLREIGVPYVLENVEDAAPFLINPVRLCGESFGIHTYRHRLFEPGGWTLPEPAHKPHHAKTVKMGRALQPGDYYHAVGNFTGVDYVRRDMRVEWMNREGIRECIPPVYGEYIGGRFRAETGV